MFNKNEGKNSVMKKADKMNNSIIWLICILFLLGFSGCGSKNVDVTSGTGTDTTQTTSTQGANMTTEDEYITGGHIDNTDPNAPKHIESTEITEFDSDFYAERRWNKEEISHFIFQIKKDESGVLTAYEKETGISCPADEYLLEDLQDIIEARDLVSYNGWYEKTNGIPPEFGPFFFKATYESGEVLEFTMEGPAEWRDDVYDVFAEWFSENGIDDLYPEKPDANVTRINFKYVDEEMAVNIHETEVLKEDAIDGETHLLELDYEDKKNPELSEELFIKIPDGYFKRITEIINGSDIVRDHYFGLLDSDVTDAYNFLDVYFEYDDDTRVSVETHDKSQIERERFVIDQMLSYHESIFGKRLTADNEDDMTPIPCMSVFVGDTFFGVEMEYNPSREAFVEKLGGGISIDLHDEEGSVKVGELPWELPRDDEEMTARPGEIILCGENSIAICYEEYSGSFTKIGKFTNFNEEDIKKIQHSFGGDETVTVNFIVEWTE